MEATTENSVKRPGRRTRSITPEERRFVENIVLYGMTKDKAVSDAFPSTVHQSRKNRDVKASMLMRKNCILEYKTQLTLERDAKLEEGRVKALRELQDKDLWKLQDSINALRFVIETAQKDALRAWERLQEDPNCKDRAMTRDTANAIIAGVQELNKILGLCDIHTNTTESSLVIIDNDYKEG